MIIKHTLLLAVAIKLMKQYHLPTTILHTPYCDYLSSHVLSSSDAQYSKLIVCHISSGR